MITRRSLLSAATALSAGASSLFNSSKVVKADNHLSSNINPTENSTVEQIEVKGNDKRVVY